MMYERAAIRSLVGVKDVGLGRTPALTGHGSSSLCIWERATELPARHILVLVRMQAMVPNPFVFWIARTAPPGVARDRRGRWITSPPDLGNKM